MADLLGAGLMLLGFGITIGSCAVLLLGGRHE